MRERIYYLVLNFFIALLPFPGFLAMIYFSGLQIAPDAVLIINFIVFGTVLFVINLVVMFSAVFYYAYKAYKNDIQRKPNN